MTASLDKLSAARALDLARDGLSRQGAPASLPDRLLVVDAERQVATWLEGGKPVAAWPVSTARNGIGGAEGSFRTPPGWHAIRRRIGEQAALGAVFVSRAEDRRAVVRRGARRRSHPDPHPDPRWARGGRQSGRRLRLARPLHLSARHQPRRDDRQDRLAWLRAPVRTATWSSCSRACAKAISC